MLIRPLFYDAGADLGGGCRVCAPPLPEMTCGFLIQLVFCQKKTMWFIGVEVEQETSAPPPKKNPGSAPVTFALLFSLWIDLVTVFDAILTSRQPREKVQCLYENLMSKNFRKTAVLKKNKAKATQQRIVLTYFGGRTWAYISPYTCFRFSTYSLILVCNFSRKF